METSNLETRLGTRVARNEVFLVSESYGGRIPKDCLPFRGRSRNILA